MIENAERTSEDRVFDKLRQLPIDDMLELIESHHQFGRVFDVCGKSWTPTRFQLGKEQEAYRVNLLNKNGWNPDEFYMEIEKNHIKKIVTEYNSRMVSPTELIEYAREFFPGIKFTQAKIELE